jgi:hypothetical protein
MFVRLYRIVLHYLISGTTLVKIIEYEYKYMNKKCVFSLQICL